MQGIRPEGLSNEELLKYIWLLGDKLPLDWITELAKRFEALLDDNK